MDATVPEGIEELKRSAPWNYGFKGIRSVIASRSRGPRYKGYRLLEKAKVALPAALPHRGVKVATRNKLPIRCKTYLFCNRSRAIVEHSAGKHSLSHWRILLLTVMNIFPITNSCIRLLPILLWVSHSRPVSRASIDIAGETTHRAQRRARRPPSQDTTQKYTNWWRLWGFY